MRRLSLKAAITGGIFDVSSTSLLTVVAILISIGGLNTYHPSQGGNDTFTIDRGPIHVLLACMGYLSLVAGGYIAARIAKHDELLNGAASAWLCVLIDLINFSLAPNDAQIVRRVALELAAPLLGLVGGYVRLLQKGPEHAATSQ